MSLIGIKAGLYVSSHYFMKLSQVQHCSWLDKMHYSKTPRKSRLTVTTLVGFNVSAKGVVALFDKILNLFEGGSNMTSALV